MDVVEAISIISALVGISLATVAIAFTWRVDSKNQALNLRFTETLTSINEKSANTQVALDRTVSQIVDAFIQTRVGAIPNQSFTNEEGDDGGISTEKLRMERMEQQIEELNLRSRIRIPLLYSTTIFVSVDPVAREKVRNALWTLPTVTRVSSAGHADSSKGEFTVESTQHIPSEVFQNRINSVGATIVEIRPNVT